MKLANQQLRDIVSCEDFFPFACEGEDCFLLRHGIADSRVYRLGPEDQNVVPTDEVFPQFVERHAVAICVDVNRPPNSVKAWAVQFALKTEREQAALQIIRDSIGVHDRLSDPPEGRQDRPAKEHLPASIARLWHRFSTNQRSHSPWRHSHTSPAGVAVFVRVLNHNGRALELKRQEYAGWKTPIFYLDWEEAVSQLKNVSVIESLDAAFANSDLKDAYALADYGLLPKKPK